MVGDQVITEHSRISREPEITYSKLTIEAPKQGVKYAQS